MKFIPQNPSKTHKLANHTVFEYEENNMFYAVGYRNRKQLFHYRYGNAASREKSINEKLEYYKKEEVYEAQRQAEKAAKFEELNKNLQVGSIVAYSWGWEQTNYQFYQVVARKGKNTVVLRELEVNEGPEDGFMTALVKPENKFRNENLIEKKLSPKYGEYLKMEYGVAQLWDGKAKRITWYA